VKWLAILLALASLGGDPTPKAKKRCPAGQTLVKHHCKKKPAKKKPAAPKPTTPSAPRTDKPADAQPTPSPDPAATPTPAQTPTATPTPTPVYPRRTAVDLVEWDIRSSYVTLAAGRVTFNTNNLGEDDHNLSVRGGGHEYGKIDLGPGDSGSLALDLAAGSYTLYCSLPEHETAGMRLVISVR
jgi:hypothetical protein